MACGLHAFLQLPLAWGLSGCIVESTTEMFVRHSEHAREFVKPNCSVNVLFQICTDAPDLPWRKLASERSRGRFISRRAVTKQTKRYEVCAAFHFKFRGKVFTLEGSAEKGIELLAHLLVNVHDAVSWNERIAV